MKILQLHSKGISFESISNLDTHNKMVISAGMFTIRIGFRVLSFRIIQT